MTLYFLFGAVCQGTMCLYFLFGTICQGTVSLYFLIWHSVPRDTVPISFYLWTVSIYYFFWHCARRLCPYIFLLGKVCEGTVSLYVFYLALRYRGLCAPIFLFGTVC